MHFPPFSIILTMSLPPKRSLIPMKASTPIGSTPAAKSMPTTAIDVDCHDKGHDTKGPSNSSNCARSTSCVNPAPLNDPQATPECHCLSNHQSDYGNFDIRTAFWPPPIFTWKTIPGSEDLNRTGVV